MLVAMFGLGTGELMLILLVAVVLFGANRLPQLGDSLGKTLRGFQKAVGGVQDEAKKIADDATKPADGSRPDQP